jgi:hypothetical protein
MQWRVGIYYGARASGSGQNTVLATASFYELPYSFSSQTAAQAAAGILASDLAGLVVLTRVWQVE